MRWSTERFRPAKSLKLVGVVTRGLSPDGSQRDVTPVEICGLMHRRTLSVVVARVDFCVHILSDIPTGNIAFDSGFNGYI